MTVSPDWFKGLHAWEPHLGGFETRAIIYGGDKFMTRQQTDIIPWFRIPGAFVRNPR